MVDMIQTSSSTRFGGTIGTIDLQTLKRVEASLNIHLGLDE